MTYFVCVECGEPVDALFVQYSQNNIRLNRCFKCNSIADKYIEFELILVFIDVILHRKQSFRHLLFNRLRICTMTTLTKWLPIITAILNTTLKLLVLRKTVYGLSNVKNIIHAAVSTVLESICFLLVFFAVLRSSKVITAANSPTPSADFNHGDDKQRQQQQPLSASGRIFNARVYLALQFPELFKLAVLVIQIFDTEPNLLFLFGLVILSIQSLAFRTATNMSSNRVSILMCIAVSTRITVRCLFYTIPQQMLLGLVL